MKHKAILSACLSSLILVSCSFSESKKTVQEIDFPVKKEAVDLVDCKEIKKFPAVFSHATEKLKTELNVKGVKPLTKEEKLKHLSLEAVPTEVTDEDFRVFAVNKITYEKATLIIYLVKEIQTESSHERDQLVLVIYNKEGKAMNVLSKNLQDVFSTREFEFTSPTEFNIVDTDSEYSVDPESEAEDIKNGREPEPSIMTSYYEIDPVKMKFKELN
jgi:hypothetical protein